MRTTIVASALAASLICAIGSAQADPDARLNIPRDQWLTPAQLSDKLAAQGYKVTEIETDDGSYEVDLIDKNGTRIEAHAHPATGELLVGYDD